jgi:hypothetical protein
MNEEIKKIDSIPIRQNLKDSYVYFNSLQQFTDYYLQHREAIDKEHTRTLNG